MGLHHLRRLRRVFSQVRRTLKPDGLFIVNEYVGPARFQMSQVQVDLINEWLDALPQELRRTPHGEVRGGFRAPALSEVIARDPSEAISSHRILPLLERYFTVLERIDYGGNLLNWVLDQIMQNFDPDNPDHRAWLERLYQAERQVLETGLLKSDFTFIIARPR